MLTKLLKYEFKASGRTFGGLYLALICLSMLIGVILRLHTNGAAGGVAVWSNSITGAAAILMIVYFALIVATIVLTLVTIVNRFERNLLGGEGYLMQTLPVSTEQLLASKLISALVWILASGLVWLASILVMVFSVGVAAPIDTPAEFLQRFREEFGLPLAPFLLGVLLAVLAGAACGVLCLYAARMIGHQWEKYNTPVSVLAFFGLCWVQAAVLGLLGFGGYEIISATGTAGGFRIGLNALNSASGFWLDVAITAVPCLVFGALYFALADWLMKKHLNLT